MSHTKQDQARQDLLSITDLAVLILLTVKVTLRMKDLQADLASHHLALVAAHLVAEAIQVVVVVAMIGQEIMETLLDNNQAETQVNPGGNGIIVKILATSRNPRIELRVRQNSLPNLV